MAKQRRVQIFLAGALVRVWQGLGSKVSRRDWVLTAQVFGVFALCVWSFGFITELYRFAPDLDREFVQVALIAFFVPAIGEEVFFRGLLIPKAAPRNVLVMAAVSLALYLVWHPINALLFFPSAVTYFSDWRFLVVTAFLGIACSYLWLKSLSLWPSIFVHWLAVVIWKGVLGAPSTM